MTQSHLLPSIFVDTQQLRIGGDVPPSAEGQDNYGMSGESSPESKHSFNMNGSPSPVTQDDFRMGGSLSPAAWDEFGMGGSPCPVARDKFGIGRSLSTATPDDLGMDSPLPTLAGGPFRNPLAFGKGKCAPPSSASEVPEGHGVANSEALQEMGDQGNFGMDGPPSPTAQDDFGMDLALPAKAGECVGIPSAARTQDVKYLDSFGMDGPPLPMAQDNFGMDLPILPGVHAQETGPASSQQDGLLDEGTRADLSLPTEAGEHVRIPLAAHIVKLSGHPPSPISSQIQEGQDGESSKVLQEVQVQHAPELALEDEFDVSTQAAILCAEGSRLCQIHGQVWNIYQQEKEMSEVIDKMIDELDNA
ncbi:hypothetical protein EDB85DRAFT_2149307 [Lactarius pseudohatsudake]|nr:hypothetical protein EDB85DRAFT_2149307 [Lactarius pseudohatsudake]